MSKKQLTFKQIAPNWARVITKTKIPNIMVDKNGEIHNLGNPACCVVGEAYKWRDKYDNIESKKYCEECDDFCMAFWHKRPKTLDREPRSIETIIKQFVEHWNKVHLK